MTPMIDVVFLLVIFFLLSSHLARRETQLELPLPMAISAAADDRTTGRITLNILPDRMFLGAEPVTQRALVQRFTTAREKEGDQLELRIRADQSIGYGQLAPALKAAAEVGLWDVNLAVLEETAHTENRP